MTELEDLRREYDNTRIGPEILTEIRALVRQVARTYPPMAYARVPTWTDDALDDLVQDFVTDWLLAQGQLAYALKAATSKDAFRAITAHTIRRALRARKVRSVVDNLLHRCQTLLTEAQYEVVRIGNSKVYRLHGANQIRDPSDEELRAAELLAAIIPRLPGQGGDRASAVYTTPNLRALLNGVASCIPEGFSLTDLDHIFRRLLTAWVPVSLVTGEEPPPTPSEELSPEDVVIVRDTVSRLLRSLTPLQRRVLRLHLARVSDAEAASALGFKARQTVLKRRSEVARIVSHHLEGLASKQADAVVHELAVGLAMAERGSSE